VAPPRVPTERKRRLGNPGKRALPSDNVIAIAPARGEVITSPTSGEELVRALMDSAASRLTGWLSLLGLTPSDRSRLGVAEVKAKSRLEALRERRESRNRAS
jgi:phage terminase small subunit